MDDDDFEPINPAQQQPDDVGGEGLIKLLIPTRHLQEPNLPVQWCVSRELLRRLEDASTTTPYLLLCVTDPKGYEVVGARQLVPLDQLQTRIMFNKPGPHTVHARVVWDGGLHALRARYFSQGSDELGRSWYKHDVFNFYNRLLASEAEGKSEEEFLRNISIDKKWTWGLGLAKETVVVPDGMFAKPIPRWLAWWIMFPHGGTLRLENQCRLRERALLSILKLAWAPLAATVIVLAKGAICLGWTLIFFAKGANWWPVLHPFQGWNAGTHLLPQNGRRFDKIAFGLGFPWDEEERDITFWWGSLPALLSMPIVWIVDAGVGIVACQKHGIVVTLANVLWYGAVTLTVAVLGLTAVAGIGFLFFAGLDWLGGNGGLRRRFIEWFYREQPLAAAEFESRFEDIVCMDGRTTFRPLSQMPKRPIVLFNELKSYVCKPFAR